MAVFVFALGPSALQRFGRHRHHHTQARVLLQLQKARKSRVICAAAAPGASAESAEPVKIILVGSTGNGKSAAANAILEPTMEHIYTNPSVKVGRNNKPCTDKCEIIKNDQVHIMDTPGLNESDAQDLGHMIDVVENLDIFGSVNAVALVVKLDSRIDKPYRDTLNYYKRLMGEAFMQNLVVLVTGRKDPPNQYDLDAENCFKEKLDNIGESIQKEINLKHPPLIFQMDCRPSEDAGLMTLCKSRGDLLEYLKKQIPSVVSNLGVPKTDAVLRQDAKEAEFWEGQQQANQTELVGLNDVPDSVKRQICVLKARETKLSVTIQEKEARLKKMDRDVHVKVDEWQRKWGWAFYRAEASFCIETDTPISNHSIYTESGLDVKHFKKANKRVEGTIFSTKDDWLGSPTVEVKVFSYQRDVEAESIANLRREIRWLEEDQLQVLQERKQLEMMHPDVKEKSQRLREELTNIANKIKELHHTHMPLDIAKKRYETMKHSEATGPV